MTDPTVRKWVPRKKPAGVTVASTVPEIAGLESTASALRGGAMIKRRQGAMQAAQAAEKLAEVYEAGALAMRDALAIMSAPEQEAPVAPPLVSARPASVVVQDISKGKKS